MNTAGCSTQDDGVEVRKLWSSVWKNGSLSHPKRAQRLLQFGPQQGNIRFADVLVLRLDGVHSFDVNSAETYQKLLYETIDSPLHLKVLTLRNRRGWCEQVQRLIALSLSTKQSSVDDAAPERYCLT